MRHILRESESILALAAIELKTTNTIMKNFFCLTVCLLRSSSSLHH